MTKIELETTTLTVSDLAKLAKKGPIILMRKGKPLAAIKDLSGTDWESISLANNSRFIALIEESRRSYREEGGITLDQIRAELGLTDNRRRGTRKKKKTTRKETVR